MYSDIGGGGGGRLGVKVRAFHLGDYRRAHMGPNKDVPHDYFFVDGESWPPFDICVCPAFGRSTMSSHYNAHTQLANGCCSTASAESVKLRQAILQKCRIDLYHFMDQEGGQVAIYDAVNALAEGRRQLAKEFAKHDIQTIFVESFVDDHSIIEENVRRVKISSPDYAGWDSGKAVAHYLARMNAKIPYFETMREKDLRFIKVCQGKAFRQTVLTSSDRQSTVANRT